MEDFFFFALTQRQALKYPEILALRFPRRVRREENPVRAVLSDYFNAFVGVEVEHRRGVHVNRLAAELAEYLVGHFVAAHVRENQSVVDYALKLTEYVQNHIGRAVHMIAEAYVDTRVSHDVQAALCCLAHDVNVPRVVEVHALIVGVELDAEESAFFDEIQRAAHVPAVGVDSAVG